jgi:hypothetical protein
MTAVRIVRCARTGGSGFWADFTDDAKVLFRYDLDLIDIIRQTPGRRWNSEDRYWTVPDVEVDDVVRRLRSAGADVSVEQPAEHREPPPREEKTKSSSGNPFVTVLGELPSHLRKPMYKAMALVLHPDIGGDTVLMQKLNAAWQVYERSAG